MRNPNLVLRYDEVARIITGNKSATAADGVKWIEELCADLQIPSLKEYGISAEHIDTLVQKGATSSSMQGNPIVLTREELTNIITSSM